MKFQDATRMQHHWLSVLPHLRLQRGPAVTAGYLYNRILATTTSSLTVTGTNTARDSATRQATFGLATSIFISGLNFSTTVHRILDVSFLYTDSKFVSFHTFFLWCPSLLSLRSSTHRSVLYTQLLSVLSSSFPLAIRMTLNCSLPSIHPHSLTQRLQHYSPSLQSFKVSSTHVFLDEC